MKTVIEAFFLRVLVLIRSSLNIFLHFLNYKIRILWKSWSQIMEENVNKSTVALTRNQAHWNFGCDRIYEKVNNGHRRFADDIS